MPKKRAKILAQICAPELTPMFECINDPIGYTLTTLLGNSGHQQKKRRCHKFQHLSTLTIIFAINSSIFSAALHYTEKETLEEHIACSPKVG